MKKPEEAIYCLVLQVTQRDPQECVFIDNRALNLECASDCGLHTIHYQNPVQLVDELSHIGVEISNER